MSDPCGRVSRLFRHPIKSIGSEPLKSVKLRAGEPMPGDRLWAIAHGKTGCETDAPDWMSCENFLRIANAPALAPVEIASVLGSSNISARHPAAESISADLATDDGLAAFADWAGALAGPVPGPYRVVRISAGAFTDSEDMVPSIMSLASLRDLSARMGVDLDPRRFRGNIWIDGVEPWLELDWSGREIRIGAARLRVTDAIPRCRATMANPETGLRDADPLAALSENFGHTLFGMEAAVIEGGEVNHGDSVEGPA